MHNKIFMRVRIVAKSDYKLRHACQSSVRLFTSNNWAHTGQIFMKFHKNLCQNSAEKIQVSSKSDTHNEYSS